MVIISLHLAVGLLCTSLWASSTAALDVRWTPGPDADARGNSFSSRRRFQNTKPGERLPSYYYADDSAPSAQGTATATALAVGALALLVAAVYFARPSGPPGTEGVAPNAEQVRQARAARFGFAQEQKDR